METFSDVIIIGLGAAGSAAAYHLSKTDKRVIGIDRYAPPHVFGSSHGESRIIRQAYFESPLYVPFVKKALQEWIKLEEISGRKLFVRNGSLMLGDADSEVIRGALSSAQQHGLAYSYLDSSSISARYPALKPEQSTVAVFEEDAGVLLPEACISAHLDLAAKNGVRLKFDEKVTALEQMETGVKVTTNKACYITGKVIVSTGAWANELLGDLKLPLEIERRTVHWFRDKKGNDDCFSPKKLPVYIWEYEHGKMFYGFPDLGNGIKIASTKKGAIILPDELNREIDPAEIEEVTQLVSRYFSMDAMHIDASVCMYANTPDENFIIDFHPIHPDVIITSPCSGHGFKFSSMTGKLLAQMATDAEPEIDILPFSLARFTVL